MKKILKIIGFIFLVVIAVIAAIFGFAVYKGNHPFQFIKTGGTIEAKYMKNGPEAVESVRYDVPDSACIKQEIWYPASMKDSSQTWPAVVVANGTGTTASKTKPFFEHLASWGFVVIGNEDGNTRSGKSVNESMEYLLDLSRDSSSVFYQKIDPQKLAVTGHSQGGIGAVNAATNTSEAFCYHAIYTASATGPYWASDPAFGPSWKDDPQNLHIPVFMTAGTGPFDAGTATNIKETSGQGICPLYGMEIVYKEIPEKTPKLMARRKDADHGEMLYDGDAYMIAWFQWHLLNDQEAAEMITEIEHNPNWEDVQTNLNSSAN